MTLPVAILAGGLATRLGPITKKVPKSLVEVAGQPFIFRQLEYLESQGIERVVLCVGHMGELIKAVVGSGKQFGLKVIYSADEPILLGTGGAIKKALPFLGENFFVLYGDSFLPIDYSPIEQDFLASGKPALMTILRNSDRWDKSNVSYAEGALIKYNKSEPSSDMEYIDYGLGILSRDLFDSYQEGVNFDLSDIYQDLSNRSKLQGYLVKHRFYEIGSHEGLEETINFFKPKSS